MDLYEAFISSVPAYLRVRMAVRGRYQAYVETEGGEDALFVAVNRSMENAVIPGLHLDNAEFIFGAPYPNPAGGDFKLPPFGFALLRIHREKTENGES